MTVVRLAKTSSSLSPPSLGVQTSAIAAPQANALPGEWITQTFGPGFPVQPLSRPIDELLVPREIDYPVAVNATLQPRIGYGLLPFVMLKSAYDNITEVSLPVLTIVRELLGFQPRLVDKDGNELRDHPYSWLVKSPDRELPHDVWITRFVKNALMYDAAAFHIEASRGELEALDYIDGSTLMLIVNERGRLPKPDEVSDDPIVWNRYIEKARTWVQDGKSLPSSTPAFAQVIHGVPFAWWDQNQIWYRPRSRSVDTPYGETYIERTFAWINIVANVTGFELAHYRTGNMPEGYGIAPQDWSQERLTLWEASFNNRMTSGPTERMRIRFLPYGFTFTDTKKPDFPEALYSQARDNISLGVGLPVSELGKVPGEGLGGKGFGEAMESSLFRNALMPLTTYVADAFNGVLERFGVDDATYELNLPTIDTDPEKQREAVKDLFASGIYTLNQALGEMGQPPIPGGDVHIVISNGQVIILEQYLTQQAQQPNALPDVGPKDQGDIEQAGRLLTSAARNGTLSTKTYSVPTTTSKQSKSAVDYTDHAMVANQYCAMCKHYTGNGVCELVEGTIAPSGWCKLFETKSSTSVAKRALLLAKHCGVCPEDDEYFGAGIDHETSVDFPVNHHANGVEIVAMTPDGLPPIAALWKPEGNENEGLQAAIGGPQFVREEAAYLLDRSLGFQLVPVAYVTESYGEVGAAVYYTHDAEPGKAPNEYAPEWVEKAAVLDYVLCQQDRGSIGHNYFTHPDDPTRPILIDNGLSFPARPELTCNSLFVVAWGNRPLSNDMLRSLTYCRGDASAWHDITKLVGNEAAANARTRIAQLLADKTLIVPGT